MSLLKVRVGGSKYLCKWDPHSNEVKIGDRWYPYVQIGRQLWLAKNLAYKWDGLSIDIGTSSTYPIAYYVDDDPNNDGLGLLYNWAATYNLNVNRNSLLPEGWRVSNDNDLLQLQQSVGGEDLAGYHLKSKDWPPSDDSVGFNAIQAGFMNENSLFIGNASNFWSSDDATYPKLLEINGKKDTGSIFGYHKPAAFLLRLCKDATVNIGGRDYPTTRIGNQIWLAENLDYKFKVSGSNIPIGSSGTPTTPAAWYYNNDEATYGIDGTYKCGLLYNWYAAKYLDDNKATLLPSGWHVPSKSDWDTLATEVGGASTAGTKLKALDDSVTSGFPSGWNGTDNYGFSALPCGSKFPAGNFDRFGSLIDIWLSTEYDDSNANLVAISNVGYGIYDRIKTNAYSLRLVKDAT